MTQHMYKHHHDPSQLAVNKNYVECPDCGQPFLQDATLIYAHKRNAPMGKPTGIDINPKKKYEKLRNVISSGKLIVGGSGTIKKRNPYKTTKGVVLIRIRKRSILSSSDCVGSTGPTNYQ